MSVIINEFETMIEVPINKSTSPSVRQEPPRVPQLTPHDIRNINRRERRREARLRAY